MLPKWIRKPSIFAFRALSGLSLALSGHKYRPVFVLGHMRSGSSLMAHILASHPDFIGVGETFCNYQTPNDFANLYITTCKILHKPILRRARYIVDQINHNHLVRDEVLRSDVLHSAVIMIRAPQPTLASLMKLGEDPKNILFGFGEKESLAYYLSRLEWLGGIGQILGKRAVVLEYDNLVDRTDYTLAALTAFYGIDRPFRSQYVTHRATARLGDTSNNILAGRVIRTAVNRITINKESLAAAETAYSQCRERLAAAGCAIL